jgi:hypothetical protein
MNERIARLLAQMNAVEEELRTALHEQETRVLFRVHGKRIEFEGSVRERHRRLRQGLVRWLARMRPQNLLTAPFIYGMAVPLAFLDLCLTVYQAVCFPIYRIAKVRRADYIVEDRRHLGYLNLIEQLHCTYCGYANGLIAYGSEIAARTEQYWCPIKHARKVLGSHARYARFLDYGDATDYPAKLEQFRAVLAERRT